MQKSIITKMAMMLIFTMGGVFPMMAKDTGAASANQQLTLEDIFSSNKFRGKTITDIQWLPDGSAFTFTEVDGVTGETNIHRHNVRSGNESLILEGSKLSYADPRLMRSGAMTAHNRPVKMSAYQTTGEQNTLLIFGEQKPIWRHSFLAPHYLYDINSKSLRALANADPNLQNVTLSPDGKTVAYARQNNLYVSNIADGTSVQLSDDGSDDILNGVFDWVYEEEFGRADAYRWSPDSRRIAFWRTNQSRVKSFILLDEMPYYSEATHLKYPKVGEKNAIVKIGVVDVSTGATVWMDLGNNHDIYIPRMDWTNDPHTLAIQRLNRPQNRLELLLADVRTGATRVILTDVNPAWIEITDHFTFLKTRDQFIWTSEKSGYRHIYLNDYNGRELRQLTSGDWEVSSIEAIDEKGGWVYFNAKKASPAESQLYRVPLSGGNTERLSEKAGWHTMSMAPDNRHYVATWSDVRTPTRVSLRAADGKMVRMLEENGIAALDEYRMVYPEFQMMPTGDGTTLSAYMMKPANFDPAKKYPVLVFGYGGPGSQMVLNRWGGGGAFRHAQRTLWHQLMTEKGYIVFCVDNRGTGGRGKAFRNLAYGDLSKWAVHDQIEGAKWLAQQPYVDAARIGFWGWSGGGYLTCMIMTRAADYFTTGVAVASVSDFRFYDTIWTERYMGLLSDNLEGYEKANVNNYAEGLRGNLLLIHGSGDDNVHPQNTLKFVDVLIEKNRQFDLMIYPNRNHRIAGGNTSLHLFTKITNYFTDHL